MIGEAGDDARSTTGWRDLELRLAELGYRLERAARGSECAGRSGPVSRDAASTDGTAGRGPGYFGRNGCKENETDVLAGVLEVLAGGEVARTVEVRFHYTAGD